MWLSHTGRGGAVEREGMPQMAALRGVRLAVDLALQRLQLVCAGRGAVRGNLSPAHPRRLLLLLSMLDSSTPIPDFLFEDAAANKEALALEAAADVGEKEAIGTACVDSCPLPHVAPIALLILTSSPLLSRRALLKHGGGGERRCAFSDGRRHLLRAHGGFLHRRNAHAAPPVGLDLAR